MSASAPRQPAASSRQPPFRFNPRSGYSWLVVAIILGLAIYQAWQRSAPPLAQNPLPPAAQDQAPPYGTAGEYYQVVRVADGDTMTVRDNKTNRDVRVRLIGVDAPEIDHPDQSIKAETRGYEAKIFTTRAVQKQRIRLIFDQDYKREDRYGRWLCYVYYQDGDVEKFLNVELVRAGFASVYDDRRRFPYSTAVYRQLKEAQREAQAARRGIYSN